MFLAIPQCWLPLPIQPPLPSLNLKETVLKFTPKYMKIARSLLRKIYSNADNGATAKPLSPYPIIILDLTTAFRPTAKLLDIWSPINN